MSLLTPHLGQVGGLSNPIDTTKCDDKGPSLALGLHDISQNIHPSLGLQDLHQWVLQGLLYCWGHSYKHTHTQALDYVIDTDCTQQLMMWDPNSVVTKHLIRNTCTSAYLCNYCPISQTCGSSAMHTVMQIQVRGLDEMDRRPLLLLHGPTLPSVNSPGQWQWYNDVWNVFLGALFLAF